MWWLVGGAVLLLGVSGYILLLYGDRAYEREFEMMAQRKDKEGAEF